MIVDGNGSELVEVGGGKLVGTDPDRIIMEASRWLNEPREYERMRAVENPSSTAMPPSASLPSWHNDWASNGVGHK